MVTPPEFFAFPSGHATQAFMIARLLQVLMKEQPGKSLDKLLQQQAFMIANNRVIAGVHFPVDGMAGRAIGESLAEYFIHRCMGGGWTYRAFDGTKATEVGANLLLSEHVDSIDGKKLQAYYLGNSQSTKAATQAKTDAGVPGSPLGWLWGKASTEWKK